MMFILGMTLIAIGIGFSPAPKVIVLPSVPVLDVPQDFSTPGLYPSQILAAELKGRSVPISATVDEASPNSNARSRELFLRVTQADTTEDKQDIKLTGILYIKPKTSRCLLSTVIEMGSDKLTVVWKCTGSNGYYFYPEKFYNLEPSVRNDLKIKIWINILGVSQLK